MGKEEEEEKICHLTFLICHLSLKQETGDGRPSWNRWSTVTGLTLVTLPSLVALAMTNINVK